MGISLYEVKYEDFYLKDFDLRDVEQVLADHFECWSVGGGVFFTVDVELIEELLEEGKLSKKERRILEALKVEAEKRNGAFDIMCLY